MTRAPEEVLEQEPCAEFGAQLRQIVDAIPHMITVWTPDGDTPYFNRTMREYSGLAMTEALAVDFRSRVFHPEDAVRTRDERAGALLGVAPFAIEERVRRKDGEYRWILVQYNPEFDGHGQVLR